MSKYNIVCVAGTQRHILTLMFYLLLMLSIFAWQNNIIKFQIELQIVICIGIALIAIWHVKKPSKQPYPYSWLLGKTGSWLDNGKTLQLTSKSRVSIFGIWVVLVDTAQPNIQQGRWFLPDQLSRQDYRRLSRVVLRCQSSH